MPAKHLLANAVFLFAALTSLTSLPAQTPTLVRDLNTTGYANQSSGVQELHLYKGNLYFLATTSDVGTELYRSLGGVLAPQRLTDLGPGPLGRICWSSLTPHAGNLWFLGQIETRTYLFRHDGTKTTQIAEVPGCMQVESGPGFLFLHGYNSFAVSDGTTAGTRSFSRAEWRDLREFTVLGKKLYFRANDKRTYGTELFVSDGTPAGTKIAVDIRPGKSGTNTPFGSYPGGLIVHGGKLLFEATDGLSGWNLYESDGTAAGTKKIAGLPFSILLPSDDRVALGGKVYSGHRSGSSYALYESDGTASGTKPVKTGLSGVARLTSAGGKLWFYTVAGNSLQLWTSDGTAGGTKTVKTIAQINRMPQLFPRHHDGKKLWFLGHTTTTGWEPWVSDGTSAGTHPVRDIRSGALGSNVSGFVTIPTGKTLFGASDKRPEHELWVSDGTTAGTRLFADIDPSKTATKSSYPLGVIDHGGLASFLTRDPSATWVTDGTAAGTIRIGQTGSWVRTNLGDKLFLPEFAPSQLGLLVTDGTTSGTRSIYTGPVAGMLRYRGVVYFLGRGKSATSGLGLWRTTGGQATLVTELDASASGPGYLLRATSRQLFIAQHTGKGPRLWTSDGTAAGTKEVDLTNVKPAIRQVSDLVAVGDQVYFKALSTAATDQLLYRTDGTAKGTHVLRDARANNVQIVGGFAAFGGRLLFAGRIGFPRTTSLYITDGTQAGTKLLQAFPLVNGVWHLTRFLVVRGRAAFFAETQSGAIELWSTDGTAVGTRSLKRFANLPRPISNFGEVEMLLLGDEMLFLADDGQHGIEPWITDLTATGTRMLADLNPGPGSGATGTIGLFRGSLLFAGIDGQHGNELFRTGLGAHTQVLGNGCAVQRAPELRASTPRLGSALSIKTTVAKVTAGQRGLLALDAMPRRPLHAGSGCTLHVGASAFLVPFTPSTTGATIRVTIPNQPALHGLNLPMQSVVGPSNQAPFGFDLSPGLLLCLRR